MISADTRRDSQVRIYDRADSAVFLKTNEEFGGLSNMAGGFPLSVNGLRIFTSEALYQACRFPHMPEIQRMIIAQASPMTAKMKSKPYRSESRPDWNRVRVKVMRWCLRVKLSQNWARFSELLLATGNRPIVELSWKDEFWGAKPVDERMLVGMNVLGRLLMELREEVRSGAHLPPMRVEPLEIPDFMLGGRPIQPIIGSGEGEGGGSVQRQERRAMAPEPIAMAVQVSMFDRPPVAPPPVSGISAEKEGTLAHGLKPYPAYKDSGMPWLGEVPEHWEIRSLGSLTSAISMRGRADLPLLSVVREKGVIARSTMGDDENHNFIPDDLGNYKVVRAGNLVINKMKAWQGSLGIAPTDGIVSPAYYVLDFTIGDRRFGQALLRSKPYVAYFARASDGVRIGQWDLSIAGMKRIPVIMPPLEEQRAIVRFLDYADRRIQRYIRAKKKLIALLNEQKQAIIHRAVTRGLDPNIRLKPSRVEWLGEVPEHWEVVRLRRVCNVQGGYAFSSADFGDTGVPVVRMNNLGRGVLRLQHAVRVAESKCLAGFSLKPGDILYGLSGSIGSTGSLGNYAVVRESDLPAQLNQRVARFCLRTGSIVPGYLALLIQAGVLYEQVLVCTTGTAQFNVSTNDLEAISFALPPLAEQEELVTRITLETKLLSHAVDDATREVDLLHEYRTRLIGDVVTGKIDVREAAARLPEEVEEPEALEDSGLGEEEVEGESLDDLSEEAVA